MASAEDTRAQRAATAGIRSVSAGVYDAALMAAAWFAIADTGHGLSPGDDAYGFFWLPAGLMVSALMLTKRGQWPALLIGGLLGDWAFGLAHAMPPWTIALRFAVTALQSLAGVLALHSLFDGTFRLTTARGLLWFLYFTAALAPLAGAVAGTALLGNAHSAAEFARDLWPRWGSNAMGVILLAPHMLAWSGPGDGGLDLRRRPRQFEAALLLATLAACVVAVFVVGRGIVSPLRIVLAAPALWAGLRFGLRGATSANLLLAIPIAFFTGAAVDGESVASLVGQHIGPAQVLISLVAIVSLALAIVIVESETQLEAVRQNEEFFRVALHRSPIGAAIVAPDGRFLDANAALCRIVRYSREELLARDFQSITHSDDLAAELGLLRKTLDGEIDSYTMDKRYLTGDGSVCWGQLDCVLLRNPDGTPLHFLSSIQDITQRKEAERRILVLNATLESRVAERTREFEEANRELELANRELDSFSSSVSHDLRSPLRLIDGFSQMLAREHLDPNDIGAHRDLERIRGAARRMDELIDSMLRLARQTRGPLQRETLDLTAIAQETAEMLKDASPQRRVDVRIEPGLVAHGSGALLRAVMENLIGNAWKFTAKREDARIEVGRETRNGESMFFVRDNGVGFNMVHADQLFRAFRRLHDEDEYPGTGIGLVTVQRIVQRHGGHIDFDSEVDDGACFWFSIPDRGRANRGAGSGPA